MGFCLLNNVSIAARYAQREHGAEKVLIVDWDVHHGNGTQEIFYSDGSVLFFSTHQFPWYPGTGREDETGIGDGQGSTINCPLEAGAAGQELGEVYREKLIPAAEEFDPDVVFISSGFDGRTADPLAGFELTDEDYADLTGMVMGIAHRHCDGRLISVLEGGYDPEGVGKAAGSHVQRLTQEDS
jgi:acetoin utilization deacetylase AcuC-like enzyme